MTGAYGRSQAPNRTVLPYQLIPYWPFGAINGCRADPSMLSNFHGVRVLMLC